MVQQLDKKLSTQRNDATQVNNTELINWIEERTDKDFSYLYKEEYIGTDFGPKNNRHPHPSPDMSYHYDYKFVMTAFDYFNSNNIDHSKLNYDIPQLSTLSLGYSLHDVDHSYFYMTDIVNEMCLRKLIEEFPYVTDSIDDFHWKAKIGVNSESRSAHMIAMPKGAFMSIHQDDTHDRSLTLLNYVNVDITLEDGGVYRYYIPKDIKNFSPPGGSEINKKTGYREGFLNTKFDQYDIVTNYTKVNIMLHLNNRTKEEDKKYYTLESVFDDDGKRNKGLPHLVTKNKSDKVRYTLYNKLEWKD